MIYYKVSENHRFPNGKQLLKNELLTTTEATKKWGLTPDDLATMKGVYADKNTTYWFYGARFLRGETYEG